jgi:hypothetical protein
MDNAAGLAGQTIGKYRIVEHLGRGGMAEVYKAYQPSLDRYVALKLMHAFLAADQDFIARFEREAKNVAALRHPNIVQVYDFDVQSGTPYMVMEYIEGGTLKSHLEDLARKGQALGINDAVNVVHEVGKALSYAHRHQMIHRDVKPANVLLEVGGRVILTDFGIAKILTGPSYTMTGSTIGTPSYMSPEQGLGRPGDHRSDIYALGVVLYQLATGQLPYEADTPLAVMLKHVNEPLPLPRTIKPDLPEGIQRVILKAMAKSPDDRFQSADEMLAQLENLDTAQMLAIPPASMAAGAAAHAATVAAPLVAKVAAGSGGVAPPITPVDATRIASSNNTPPPAGATIVRRVDAGVVAAPVATPAPPPAKESRLPIALLAVVGVLLLLLFLAGGAFTFTGGFGLFNKPAATSTPLSATNTATAQPSSTVTTAAPSPTALAGPPTPDHIATQFASIQQTQAAIQAAVASPTPTHTPDLTATAAACTYDYHLAGQQPEDGKTLVVGTKISKTLTIANTGLCAFKPGTVLSETSAVAGSAALTLSVPAIAPKATGDVSFDWLGRKTAGSVSRSFVMFGPSKTLIGLPITLTLKYVPGATPVPLATATVPPPAATDTPPPPAGLTDIYISRVTDCRYVGDTSSDYQCTGILGFVGGIGPFTVSVDGTNSQHFDMGQTLTFAIRSRRCTLWIHTVTLLDDGTQSAMSKQQSFDPNANGGLFPGGACTVP